MAVVLHEHDRAIDRALGGDDQRDIPRVDAEAAHGIVGSEEIEHLVGVRALDAVVLDGHQAVIDGLHDRVHHRHMLEDAGKRIQPDAAHHALALLVLGGGIALGAGEGRLLGLGRGGGGGRLDLEQVHRRGDVIEGEVRLHLLAQADGLENAAGLVVGNNAGAGLHGHDVAFAHAALAGHLLGGELGAQALGADQISQSAHKKSSSNEENGMLIVPHFSQGCKRRARGMIKVAREQKI